MDTDVQAPLDRHRGVVRPDWVDYNGHLNVAYYLVAFDHATDVFLDWVGLDEGHRKAQGGTTFTAEVHIAYKRELIEGAAFRITTQLLSFDRKRIRYLHRMFHADDGFEAASSENLSLYVDLNQRRVAEMDAPVQARLAAVLEAHARLGIPEEAGRGIDRPPVGHGM